MYILCCLPDKKGLCCITSLLVTLAVLVAYVNTGYNKSFAYNSIDSYPICINYTSKVYNSILCRESYKRYVDKNHLTEDISDRHQPESYFYLQLKRGNYHKEKVSRNEDGENFKGNVESWKYQDILESVECNNFNCLKGNNTWLYMNEKIYGNVDICDNSICKVYVFSTYGYILLGFLMFVIAFSLYLCCKDHCWPMSYYTYEIDIGKNDNDCDKDYGGDKDYGNNKTKEGKKYVRLNDHPHYSLPYLNTGGNTGGNTTYKLRYNLRCGRINGIIGTLSVLCSSIFPSIFKRGEGEVEGEGKIEEHDHLMESGYGSYQTYEDAYGNIHGGTCSCNFQM